MAADGSTVAIATVKPYTKRFREGTSQILTVEVATGKAQFFEPAPFESITTRTEDGPVYAPNGKELAFVMDDLLYVMPVDTHGLPNGAAFALNDETTDAPTWSGDSGSILYLHDGELHPISRATRAITSIAAPLTYTVSKPDQKLLIHAGRFWSGQGPASRRTSTSSSRGIASNASPRTPACIPKACGLSMRPRSRRFPGFGRITLIPIRTTPFTTETGWGVSGLPTALRNCGIWRTTRIEQRRSANPSIQARLSDQGSSRRARRSTESAPTIR